MYEEIETGENLSPTNLSDILANKPVMARLPTRESVAIELLIDVVYPNDDLVSLCLSRSAVDLIQITNTLHLVINRDGGYSTLADTDLVPYRILRDALHGTTLNRARRISRVTRISCLRCHGSI